MSRLRIIAPLLACPFALLPARDANAQATEPETAPKESEAPAAPDAVPDAAPDAPDTPDAPSTSDEKNPDDKWFPPGNAAPRADLELTPPTLKKDVQPAYPEAAEKDGIAAEVVLDIDIDATGHVESASVTVPADPPGLGFDEAALVAAQELEFEPAIYDGKAVPVTISFRFRFVPDVTPAPEAPAPEEAEPPPPPPPPTGELWGNLQERGTRLPIAGVNVTVFRGEGDDAEGFETETDADGAFRFEGLAAGEWRLLADPEGYYPLRVTEKVVKDERTDAQYSIEKRSYNPYDVIVETNRVKREVSRTSIDARQAERIPGTFGDVLAVVQNFPGVARGNLAQPVIRGSAPEDSKVYINGIGVPNLYHFGFRSVVPSGMIERVDYYPGNFSVEYGRATGGVIDVDLRDLEPKKVGGYFDINLFDTSLYLEVPIADEFAIALGGRRSYIDYILDAVMPEGGPLTVAPRYYDFQALASYRPAPAHYLEAFFLYFDDEIKAINEEPDDPEFVVTSMGYEAVSHRTMATYRYVPNPRFSNELKLSYGNDKIDINMGESIFINLDTDQGQIRNTSRYEFSPAFALRGGLDYIYQDINYSVSLPSLPKEGDGEGGHRPDTDDTRFSELSDTVHSVGAFAELETHPYESLFVLPGLRVDHFTNTDELVFSPRITAIQNLGPHWALKGGVGLFIQEPTIDELDENLGNPDLSLERALHYSAGVEYTPLPYLNFEVTGFYKTLHDLVAGTEEVVERDGETVRMNYNNEGEGRVVGLEVSAKHELANGFYGWLAYTLSQSERKDPGESEWRLFDHDQTHILTLIGSYKLPRNWEISSRFRYVSGNLYTPVVGSVFDADADRYQGIRGSINSARVGDFHQLDIRIDKRWIYESWILNAYLDIQNVYNRQNPEGLGYNFDFTDVEVQSGLPILPIIGLRGEF